MNGSSKVILYVYDLSHGMARAFSGSILGKQIDAIYHTGIVVYGYEYYYGGGIQAALPGQTMAGTPQQMIELGETEIPQDVFHEFLHNISSRFTAETYSLLKHNCNNFTNECSQFLIGREIPKFITGLPEEALNSPMGQMLRPMIEQFEANMKRQSGSFVPWQESSSSSSLDLPPTPSSSKNSSTPINRQEEKQNNLLNQNNQPNIQLDNKLKQYAILIKVISKKLDSDLQISLNEYDKLQNYITKSSDTYDEEIFKIIEKLLTKWPIKLVFPVLGMFRHFTQFDSVASQYTNINESNTIQRLIVLSSGESFNNKIKAPDRAMALSILANLVGKSNEFARNLAHNETIMDVLVASLTVEKHTIRSCAADLTFNLSLVCANDHDDFSIRLASALTEALVLEQHEKIVYCMLLSLYHLVVNNNEASQLLQALGLDLISLQNKFNNNNNIDRVIRELKVFV